MTTQYVSTYGMGVDTLGAKYTAVVIYSGGGFKGGINAVNFATISNYGILNGDGVELQDGGRVVNGAEGYPGAIIRGDGVQITGAGGSVSNYDKITAKASESSAVSLSEGGTVFNGGTSDTYANIAGSNGVYIGVDDGFVTNFGTILGRSGEGVYVTGKATIQNGAATDSVAAITGYIDGILATYSSAVVKNFGHVSATGGGNSDVGVALSGGEIKNGSTTDRSASIAGYSGVNVGGFCDVYNDGTITGEGAAATAYGVVLGGGGLVVNGTGYDISAQITGAHGVAIGGAAGTVENFGLIAAATNAGVKLLAGGSVTNGGGADRSARIVGYSGVYGPGVTVVNSGTIQATGGVNSYGVSLDGGSLVNGSANNATALIEGYYAVNLSGAAKGTNFGVVEGLSDKAGGAVALGAGASFTNGGAGHGTALVEGYDGVLASGAVTVTNFGTIAGASGTALDFTTTGSLLVVEAASVFDGAVDGDKGRLELASGTGTITAPTFTTITVSVSMPTTAFSTFNTLEVGTGAIFTLAGPTSVAAGQTLEVLGQLSAASTITSAGNIVLDGTMGGTGQIVMTAGTARFANGSVLSLAKVTQSGGTATFAAPSLTEATPWSQTGGVITTGTAETVNFTGAGDLFEGTLAGTGTIALTGGTDAITGATLSAASVAINGASATLSGAIAISDQVSVTTTDLAIASAGAALTGTGGLVLSNSATNAIKGAATTTALANGVTISGAGDLGDASLTLDNEAAGVIDGNDTAALTIDTGAKVITNAGLIEATGSGGVLIKSAVANTGTLSANGSTLTADGAITGGGKVTILANGLADFASTFVENVAFTTSGELELAKSQTYTGTISGFSKTNATSLDLLDIAFTSGVTKATYSGTTTSGTLTVTDGTHTATIKLTGNYTTSTFTVATDGHGGTLVTDPKAPVDKAAAGSPPSLATFTANAAAFGAQTGPPILAPTADQALLASPVRLSAPAPSFA